MRPPTSTRTAPAIGVAAAQRPRRMPRQQDLDLVSLFLIHSQPRSIPFALRSVDVDPPQREARRTVGARPEQQDAARVEQALADDPELARHYDLVRQEFAESPSS